MYYSKDVSVRIEIPKFRGIPCHTAILDQCYNCDSRRYISPYSIDIFCIDILTENEDQNTSVSTSLPAMYLPCNSEDDGNHISTEGKDMYPTRNPMFYRRSCDTFQYADFFLCDVAAISLTNMLYIIQYTALCKCVCKTLCTVYICVVSLYVNLGRSGKFRQTV